MNTYTHKQTNARNDTHIDSGIVMPYNGSRNIYIYIEVELSTTRKNVARDQFYLVNANTDLVLVRRLIKFGSTDIAIWIDLSLDTLPTYLSF